MDPYLENRALWPDFHNSFIAAIREWVAPLVRPRYYVALEERTYLFRSFDIEVIGRPDVAVIEGPGARGPSPKERTVAESAVLEVDLPMMDEVSETYLQVHETATKRVVTVLELLSPANKLHSRGRRKYEKKRERILHSRTHLVEVDLLRDGEPMPLSKQPAPMDYRILVSRSPSRPRAQPYAFSVRQAIPSVPLPLLAGDPEPVVDLNSILHDLYERAGFDLRLDYSAPALPPLQEDDTAWATEVIRERART